MHRLTVRGPLRALYSVNSDDEEKEVDGPIRLPFGLVGPTDERAYAESVPDNGNERE